MPINLKGKNYMLVSERVQALHDSLKDEDTLVISTEVLSHNPVVIKATVTINQCQYSGISAANPDKAIEKMSPYEIAETSALGRALGFAGFGSVESIASADEMIKASYAEKVFQPASTMPLESSTIALRDVPTSSSIEHACKTCGGPTTVKESRTTANKGRKYYACPTDNFSHWVDSKPQVVSQADSDDPFAGMGVI